MRLWPRRRPATRPRVEVTGASAGALTDALADDGLEARAVGPGDLDATADVLVLTSPSVVPGRLPRGPVRVGWIAAGEVADWDVDLLEDLDEAVVADQDTATVVASHTIAPPQVRGATGAGRQLSGLLEAHRALPSVAIVTGVSNLRMRQRWGDHHFGVATAKALRRAGWRARVLCQAELEQQDLGRADLVLLLAGKVELTPVPDTPTVAWVISHPDRVEAAALAGLDAAFVASDRFAERLRGQGVDARALHQCTDPTRFRPTPGGPPHELLFVGNARGVRRRILGDLPEGHDLAVYGYGWDESLLDPAHLRGDHVPNDQLPAYYSAAAIVLNDHWDAMRELAFPANRLYDAAACGAVVVSDHVDGLEERFVGAVVTYRDRDELAGHLTRLLADPGLRRDLGQRARQVVCDHHTFDHRVADLLAGLPGRSSGIGRPPVD